MLGDKTGHPVLIAVSSFGEDLRRELPLTAPAEVILSKLRGLLRAVFFLWKCFYSFGVHGQDYGKSGPLTNLRVQPDPTAMVIHNGIHDG